MSVYTHPVARAVPQAVRQLVWFALVCIVAFFIPYLGISVLDMQHDVFYLGYFAVTIALLASYVRVEHVNAAEIIVTATYHIGYPQYRQDGLSRPETGNVLISIPTFATANPVGSIVAHISQHIAAVTHAYESRIFNPPVTKA